MSGYAQQVAGVFAQARAHFEETERWLASQEAPHGLSAEEWEALAVLRRTSSQADATPGRLARDLMLTAGAATARLDRLERKGLVRRKAHPDNRRVVLLELTAAGERAKPGQTAYLQEGMPDSGFQDRLRRFPRPGVMTAKGPLTCGFASLDFPRFPRFPADCGPNVAPLRPRS